MRHQLWGASAWLVLAVIACNLTRAAAAIAGTGLAKATTATIHRKLVTVQARIASSARRITLHLPDQWPWETAGQPYPAGPAAHQRPQPPDQPAETAPTTKSGTCGQRGPTISPARDQTFHSNRNQATTPTRSVDRGLVDSGQSHWT